jgi:hypothetical protein
LSQGYGVPRTTLIAGVFSLLAALMLLRPLAATAVPYASGLSNFNGTVSFRLNEAADNVKIVSAGGIVTNDLGALPAGWNSFALGVTGTVQVVVFKAGPPGFLSPIDPNRGAVLQISPDTPATRFFSPRGLAVNTHPASPHFGRIYVANATSGTVSNGLSGAPRTTGDGLYALNPDFTDALGQGDAPLTGGLDFAAGLDLSPNRLTIGQDDNLYVCDLSETNGGLYVVGPEINPGSGTNVLGGPAGGLFPVGNSRVHGSIAAAVMEGSLAASNLMAYVIDEDLQTDRAEPVRTMLNSLWLHYLLGELPGPRYNTPELVIAAPWVGFASQIMDLSRGTNGFFYVNTFRSPGNDWAGLYVHDASGDPLWNSLEATRAHLNDPDAADLLRATGGGDVSPQGDLAAAINLETGDITVLPLVGGLPDLAHRLAFDGFPGITDGQGRDVAFDAAGNLYAISSGAQALRAFSPGGRTTAITGSDGTFRVIRPPTVKVIAVTPVINEGGSAGVFTICRTGDSSGDLTVAFALSGTADPGSDYLVNASVVASAIIPAGATDVEIAVTPVNDALSEPVETVTLTLLGSAEYDLGIPAAATLAIADDDLAVVSITAVDARAYERLPADTITFVIERTGETNSDLSIDYGIQAGTADPERDYTGVQGGGLPARIYLAPGQRSESLVLAPLDDLELEGNETVIVTLFSGASPYVVGTPNRAEGVIIDNEMPPDAVLFSDSFDDDTSAGWVARFGANNEVFDAEVRWAFDYGALDIPPAPNSAPGSTRGLFVQVNKTNATAGGSAAINLYPAGRSFSGNYALRFDMLLNFGAVSPTEHALAGLNHSGLLTNRVTQSTDANGTTRGGDGVFVAIESDGTGNREWAAYTVTNTDSVPVLLTNRAAADLAWLIPSPPYAAAGSPGVGPSDAKTWAEVELAQQDGVITLSVNKGIIYSFTNTSGFDHGNILIGHSDQFDSIGSGGTNGNFVLFDNVRVVTPGLFITKVELIGDGQVQIDFISPPGQSDDFHLQSSADLASSSSSWADEDAAILSATPQGFRFVAARSGGGRFYRIRH